MNSYLNELTTKTAIDREKQKINKNLPKAAKILGAIGLATQPIGSGKTQALILTSR